MYAETTSKDGLQIQIYCWIQQGRRWGMSTLSFKQAEVSNPSSKDRLLLWRFCECKPGRKVHEMLVFHLRHGRFPLLPMRDFRILTSRTSLGRRHIFPVLPGREFQPLSMQILQDWNYYQSKSGKKFSFDSLHMLPNTCLFEDRTTGSWWKSMHLKAKLFSGGKLEAGLILGAVATGSAPLCAFCLKEILQ